MRAKVKGQRSVRLDVPRFDSVVRFDELTPLGPQTRIFVRCGEKEYQELGPIDASRLVSWAVDHQIEMANLSLADVNLALKWVKN